MIQKWKELSRKRVFDKYHRGIDEILFELPDGSTDTFYIRYNVPTASVLAITPENEVILVRQYRPGPEAIIDDMPGGNIDQGEEPLQAAARELLEETGYQGELSYVGSCFDDAYSSWVKHCIVAQNCTKVGEPQHTATEQTEVITVSVETFRKHLRGGQLGDVNMGYMALDYLGLLSA